jgi:anti-anti-sigma factor
VTVGSMPASTAAGDRVSWVRSREAAETLIRVVGDLDFGCAGPFAAAFAAVANNGSGVIIDMAGVEFIDAAALGGIDRAQRLYAILGLPFAVRSPSPAVRRVLDMFPLDGLIEQAEPTLPQMFGPVRPRRSDLGARSAFGP